MREEKKEVAGQKTRRRWPDAAVGLGVVVA